MDNRAGLNGIWSVLGTGCQWKAVHKAWFGVCSSTLHERFQTWQQRGGFAKITQIVVKCYAKKRKSKGKWQAIASNSCPAPLGGEQTEKTPTDRGNRGSNIHLLVDQRGAPLAVMLTGANAHDTWAADDLIIASVVTRPKTNQYLGADTGYDVVDVRHVGEHARDIVPIKHKRKRGEPAVEACPLPGETRFPARRWVGERTLGWLAKRRSLRIRWCKKVGNWLAFVQFACAHILMDMAIYG